MESPLTSACAACCLLFVSLCLVACQPKLPGTYELDFEQTKQNVLKTVEAHPTERARQKDVLEMLQATRLTVRLLEGGKMETVTELTNQAAATVPARTGWWKQDGAKVVMAISDEDPHPGHQEPETKCDIDGKRLRCFKPMPQKLFENYVLVRK